MKYKLPSYTKDTKCLIRSANMDISQVGPMNSQVGNIRQIHQSMIIFPTNSTYMRLILNISCHVTQKTQHF